jgi:hypothetical protein
VPWVLDKKYGSVAYQSLLFDRCKGLESSVCEEIAVSSEYIKTTSQSNLDVKSNNFKDLGSNENIQKELSNEEIQRELREDELNYEHERLPIKCAEKVRKVNQPKHEKFIDYESLV